MKKVLILALLITLSVRAFAQGYDDYPNEYDPKATQIINDPNSPCNQGDESFLSFISKFRIDRSFRVARTAFETKDSWVMDPDFYKSQFDYYIQDNSFWKNFQPHKLKVKGTEESFNTWYAITADQVCFEIFECDTEDLGASLLRITTKFRRINGKWYITLIE